ncbi:hypothetical protein HU675_0020065 [Bradyrhizobium septentrionale]|uniref:hypothetical protein n=1 Tax=Bradyrhizobium septentrionale TaxID=1404411 RepID=UPI0015965261|nr:hypothetical protein [Bradyrhizobium septentrionale]UGY28879.1 hypothetical protein HU675_0020065 [Bradyrhizobium septentrionale]
MPLAFTVFAEPRRLAFLRRGVPVNRAGLDDPLLRAQAAARAFQRQRVSHGALPSIDPLSGYYPSRADDQDAGSGFAAVAAGITQNKVDPIFFQAVIDPAGYFDERDVETLVLVRPILPPDDAAESDALLPRPRIPPSDHTDFMTLDLLRPDGSPDDLVNRDASTIKVIEAEPGSAFETSFEGRWLDWIFVPHEHEWHANRAQLRAKAYDAVRLDPDHKAFKLAFAEMLKTKAGISTIKAIYSYMNSNGTSMSFYFGPKQHAPMRIVYECWTHHDPTPRRQGKPSTEDCRPLLTKRSSSSISIAKIIGSENDLMIG